MCIRDSNYIEGRHERRGNATDDGRAHVLSYHVMVQTGGTGSGSSHGHYLDGYGNVSGNPGYSGSLNVGSGDLGIGGSANVSFPSISIGSGDLGISGSVTDNRAITSSFNGSINGNVGFTAGNIALNVSYVDVIICVRT